jgi:hypothetical protein
MTMLELTKEELDRHKALVPGLNQPIQNIVDAINIPTVDPRMKATIAVAQLTTFASQFKRNVVLWDHTSVPINAISFIITGSGGGKDSSVKAARKCFKNSYERITSAVHEREKQKAILAAQDAGETSPDMESTYKDYMNPIPPIDIMPTTGPGLIQHINDIGALDMSSGFLYTGEFADELAYNQDMSENIKILSEVYDTGDKEVKYTKGSEHRSQEIISQAVNALLVGSPSHILYDPTTKKKFDIAFMSKLARRSWFCYTPDKIPEPTFDNINDMLQYEDDLEATALKYRKEMQDELYKITDFGIATANQDITVSKEVEHLFKVYKRYNNEYVDSLPSQDTTYALIRRHLQWKSLKLAGAFAIFDQSNEIQLKHYIDAIRFAELLDQDMELFEHDLNKSLHEKFSDYMKTLLDNEGKASISVHDIKKNGFINSVTMSKLQELVTLCSGYDTNGIYKIDNEGGSITYESIIKTDVLGVSYKPIDTTSLNAAVSAGNSDAVDAAKHDIALTTAYGFESIDATFAQLGELLQGDYAYSPFKFRNGVRGRDNLVGGTKWITLDIDHTTLTAAEAHFMLSDINHYVALSSDPNNDCKYRVILELDSVVDVDRQTWKHFYLAIAEELALKVDPLPQSQIFYSYAGRPVMSVTDAEPVKVRKYLMIANEKSAQKSSSKPISSAHSKALLADPFTTFNWAFEAANGEGSRQIIRAIYYAKELGADLDYCLNLFNDIQDYWISPFPEERREQMIEQITRMF